MRQNKEIYIHITPFFPSEESFRGPFVLDQVKALQMISNYDVRVIKVVGFNSTETNYSFQGVDVFVFKLIRFPSGILPNLLSRFNTFRLINFLRGNGFSLDNIKYIHGHVLYPCGLLAVKIANELGKKIKSIVQHHGIDAFSFSNGICSGNKFHQLILKRKAINICREANFNVGVSKRVINELNFYCGEELKNSLVLYNGVNKEKFYPLPAGSKNEIFTVGCVANFWPLKDQITLIKAIEIILLNGGNIKAKFVGTGPTLKDCQNYIAQKNLQDYFYFVDSLQHSELNAFYNTLDLFVLPSFYEALGCVYLEAFVSGIPFIGVKGQGIQELIVPEQQELFLIEKEDYLGLSEIIKKYMINKPTQLLTKEIDINTLVFEFMHKINN